MEQFKDANQSGACKLDDFAEMGENGSVNMS
jgi:hypothetical protein